MRMYYMTSAKWGEVILKERRLKLSRFFEANDPFELSLIDNRPRDTRQIVRLIGDYFNDHIGMICFGANWSSPVMWAHYADKHSGVCLGFDVEDSLLTKVVYTDQKITVPLGAHLPKHGLNADLLSKVRMTKATDWAYEREYRVEGALKQKDSRTGLYYIDFGPQVQLRELIMGHRCEWTIDNAFLLIAEKEPVRICKARPAFGKFEMIESNDFRPRKTKPRKP
jgi:hypothetical protein